jgi:hypothetical protein
MEFDVEGTLAEALLPIWPQRAPALDWPPMYMMDRELLQVLALPPSGIRVRVWPITEPPGPTVPPDPAA